MARKRRGQPAPSSVPATLQPAKRRLHVFSLDPSMAQRLSTAAIGHCVLAVPWESLEPGPIGDYVEVVDVDPGSACAYPPVDLDTPELLAADGLSPSDGNPQFHQQMAYAVVMKTIENFEFALGRKVLWSPRRHDAQGPGKVLSSRDRYVPRLRIYPHALREPNAYYSPNKKALLLGYFMAQGDDPREELPGAWVFNCLSHDVLAHETTHAILDGVHPRLLEATNDDMLAFHEGFADIVAIFQHFTLPGLLLDQIQRHRGDLGRASLLSELAVQFGRATGRHGALRSALGTPGEDGRIPPPNPGALASTTEPHARGAILVAAVFDAFLQIYEHRVADLRRIATGGTGILPPGEIHPDLARRFADEAAKAAQRVLTICIRALDYLPPVDITLGDYLRALVTADSDLVPDDPHHYRLAFVEGFRRRGIVPDDVRSLGEDSLRWWKLEYDKTRRRGGVAPGAALRQVLPEPLMLQVMAGSWEFGNSMDFGDAATEPRRLDCDALREKFFGAVQASGASSAAPKVNLPRWSEYDLAENFSRFWHQWMAASVRQAPDNVLREAGNLLGIDLLQFATTLQQSRRTTNGPREKWGKVQVETVRPVLRVGPDGNTKTWLRVVLTQRRPLEQSDDVLALAFPPEDEGRNERSQDRPEAIWFRGGSTLLVDPVSGRVEYAISKRIDSGVRQARIAKFVGQAVADRGPAALTAPHEPLAMLHRGSDEGANSWR